MLMPILLVQQCAGEAVSQKQCVTDADCLTGIPCNEVMYCVCCIDDDV